MGLCILGIGTQIGWRGYQMMKSESEVEKGMFRTSYRDTPHVFSYALGIISMLGILLEVFVAEDRSIWLIIGFMFLALIGFLAWVRRKKTRHHSYPTTMPMSRLGLIGGTLLIILFGASIAVTAIRQLTV